MIWDALCRKMGLYPLLADALKPVVKCIPPTHFPTGHHLRSNNCLPFQQLHTHLDTWFENIFTNTSQFSHI
ncbi:unnamed protein product, partial [Allacma fusca]